MPTLRWSLILLLTVPAGIGYAQAQDLVQLEDMTPGAAGAGYGVDYRMQPLLGGGKLYYVVSSPENHLELWCTETTGSRSQRLRVLVHNGKTNQYYPDLLEPRRYIPYGSAELGAWWEQFPALPGLTYVNDLWGCLVGDQLFFCSHDSEAAFDNTELFVSAGTPESTRIVRDINPGKAGAGIFDVTALGEGLFFFADDGEHGKEPWYSDGTAEGTVMLADINPGSEPSRAACAIFPFRADRQAIAWSGRVSFFAQDGSGVFSLWSTDGTPSGTKRVYTTAPPEGTQMRPTSLTATQTAVFWVMADNCGRLQPEDGLPRELWRSNGTESGTERIATFDQFGAHLYDERIHTGDLTAAGDAMVFTAEKDGKFRLWRAGATGPAAPVEGVRASEPALLGILGYRGKDALVASVTRESTRDNNLMAPWVPANAGKLWSVGDTEGPATQLEHGEILLPRFGASPFDLGKAKTPDTQGLTATPLTLRGMPMDRAAAYTFRRSDAVPFAQRDDTDAAWVALNEEDGQRVITGVPLDRNDGFPEIPAPGLGTQTTFLHADHGTLFFRVERAAGNSAVFATDGTEGGAGRLFPEPPLASAHEDHPDYAFTWHQGAWYGLDKGQVCRIDVETFTSTPLGPFAPPQAKPLHATLCALDGGLFVLMESREQGIQLRRVEGGAGDGSAAASPIHVAGDHLGNMVSAGTFAVFDVSLAGEQPASTLYRCDGTEAGTTRLQEGLGPMAAYLAGDNEIFAAEWQGESCRVWRITGGAEDMREVGTARGSFGLGSPVPMALLSDGRIAMLDVQRGRLRIAGGAAQQDVRTKAFAGDDVLLSELVAWQDRLYWVTGEPNFGALRLWASDGTDDGTEVAHLFGGRLMHGLVQIVSTGDALWLAFAASDVQDDVHRELWRYTPEAGAGRVTQSDPLLGVLWEPGGTEIDAQLAVVDGRVVFMNYTVDSGAELWAVK